MTYNAPLTGSAHAIPYEDYLRTRPQDALATWHTHGFRQGRNPIDDTLSGNRGGKGNDAPGDRDNGEALGVPNYLIKPSGGAVGYDPATDKDVNVNGGDPCPCKSK